RIACFRLPVIEIQIIQEVPAAEVVLSDNLRELRCNRVRALVAEDRVPAVAVAELADKAGCRAPELELRVTRVPLIAYALIVGAGNLQDVQAEIAGIEVRAEHVLFLPGEAERLVHQQRGTERPRLPGGELVDFRVPAATRDTGNSEIVRQVVDDVV